MLIMTGIILLCLPGIVFNNMVASGYDVTPSLVCPGYPDLTCQSNTPAACQDVSTQCQLSGTSVSFLNQKSPFTALFQGNIFGFFGALTSSQSSGTQYNGDVADPIFGQGPFDAMGGNSYVTGMCTVYPIGASRLGLGDYNMTGCTQVSPAQNTNITSTQALNFTNYNPISAQATYNLALYQVYGFQKPTPFYSNYTTGANMLVGCTWEGTYNFTTTGTGSSATSTGWTWYGCEVSINGWISPPPTPTWAFMVAISNSIHLINNGYNKIPVFIQPEQWNTGDCLAYYSAPQTYSQWASQQCLTFENNVNPAITAGSSFGALTPVLSFLAGLVLFLIGLGINVQGSGTILGTGVSAGAGVNTQGTRLAQALGISLLVFSPLYSEFSTWFTSGILPNGLDGSAGIVSIITVALIFTGVFWLILTWGSE